MEELPAHVPQGRSDEEIAAIEAKEKIRGKVYREAMRWSIVNSVRRRFPSLKQFAQEVVESIHWLNALEELAIQVYEESDKATVRRLLDEAAYRAKWNIYSEFDEWVHEERLRTAARLAKKDALREQAVEVVRRRFPSLVEEAQAYVACIGRHEALEQVIERLSHAPDEAMARWLLDIEDDKRRQRTLVVELVQNRFPGLIVYAKQQVEQITNLDYLYILQAMLNIDTNEERASGSIDCVLRFQKRL